MMAQRLLCCPCLWYTMYAERFFSMDFEPHARDLCTGPSLILSTIQSVLPMQLQARRDAKQKAVQMKHLDEMAALNQIQVRAHSCLR